MDKPELDRIVFLLTDQSFKTELKTFRRSCQRLKVRLRNNQLNAKLKEVKTLIHRLDLDYPVKLFQHYRDNKPTNKKLAAFTKHISQFIESVDNVLVRALAVYCTSQASFRVGHLLQHYLVIRASLARLIYCFKALLVYSVDLYSEINTDKDEVEQAVKILIKHECKPRQVEDTVEIIEENPRKKIKIGQLIDRETMRPMRSCRQKI